MGKPPGLYLGMRDRGECLLCSQPLDVVTGLLAQEDLV